MPKKIPALTRKAYKAIKKYDHQEMNAWVVSIYQSGYEDGQESVNKTTIDLEAVDKAISGVKGIGEKRKSLIIKELERLLDEKEER